MNITKSDNKIFTNKYLNGQTINYTIVNSSCLLLFIIFKQLFKTFFTPQISVGISFVISMVLLYILEKKFVFNKEVKTKPIIQILLYIFRTSVDFGFYKIVDIIFCSFLDKGSEFSFSASYLIFFFFNYCFDKLIVFDSQYDEKNKINGKSCKLFYSNRFVILSMIVATISMLFIYAIFQLFPFGDTTVLRMDLYHQYGPLFVEYFDRITNFKSFLYSWQSGGGSSFLGNFFNYLSSPLSLIVLLFDRKQMPFAITTLVAVKGILAAGTFTFYIKKSLKSHCFASASFGVLYAFCSYFLAYYWNIMWIDGMILLPLILLGIENIINNGKSKLYIISLSLLLFSSYYMGFMCCIFSVLYFFGYFIINKSFSSKIDENFVSKNKHSFKIITNNTFINRAINFGLSSLLCGLICAFFLIPVYFILQSASATSDSFPSTFESYFNIFDFLSNHIAGLQTTIRSSGDDVLPNVYCGVITLLLVPLYIANKDIRIKEKTVYIVLLLFLLFSFDNNCMNFIWHAFHFPNDLPFRFSYIYSFLILLISYKGLIKIKSLSYKDIAMVGMMWIFALVLIQKWPTTKISEISIYITIAFIIIWSCVLLLIHKGKLSKFVLGVTIITMAFCEVIVADSNSFEFTQNQSDYVTNYDTYTKAINETYNKDKDFYRSELCYLDTRMDPCLYGYRGMSTFSSMAYEKYSGTQYSLGMFGNRINSYTYNTQTPIYNMMYSVKYLMKSQNIKDLSSDLYNNVDEIKDKNTTIYENKYFLPIAYEVSSDVKNWEVVEGDPFELQQDFLYKATGANNVFKSVEYISSNTESLTCDEVNSNSTFYFNKDDSDANGSIDVTIKSTDDSNVYVYITSPEIKNVNYYWNEDRDTVNQNIDEPYIMDLGKHKKGDEIRINLDCSSLENNDSYFEIYAYNLDKNVLNSAYDMLKLGSMDITSYSDTKIEGTINAGFDGFIYTSIPYDEGWNVYIDGNKCKTFDIGDSQLATTVKTGNHKIEFKYTPKGLNYSIFISLVTFIGLIGYKIFKIQRKKKNFVENE